MSTISVRARTVLRLVWLIGGLIVANAVGSGLSETSMVYADSNYADYYLSGSDTARAPYKLERTLGFIASARPNLLAAFYRFNDPRGPHHLSVAGEDDLTWIMRNTAFQLEGITGYLMTVPWPGTEPLYRLYNESSFDRLYLTRWDDVLNVEKNFGYKFERVEGYVYSRETPGTVPLYRLYNSGAKDHLYTLSTVERDQTAGYQFDMIVGYVVATSPYQPLFALADGDDSSAVQRHFYMAAPQSLAGVLKSTPFTLTGILGYVSTSQHPGMVGIYQTYSPEWSAHTYSTDLVDLSRANEKGYQDDGGIGFIYASKVDGTVPLNRFSPYRPPHVDRFNSNYNDARDCGLFASPCTPLPTGETARLNWSASPDPTTALAASQDCGVTIYGRDNTGAQVYHQEFGWFGRQTDVTLQSGTPADDGHYYVKFQLQAWCSDRHNITPYGDHYWEIRVDGPASNRVPTQQPTAAAQLHPYWFVVHQDSMVTPCFVVFQPAASEAEALQKAQLLSDTAEVTMITQQQYTATIEHSEGDLCPLFPAHEPGNGA